MRKIDKLFYRWLAAERAWTREIERRFGAGSARELRYLPAGAGVGDLTATRLRVLAAAFACCREAWVAENRRLREAAPCA